MTVQLLLNDIFEIPKLYRYLCYHKTLVFGKIIIISINLRNNTLYELLDVTHEV